MSIKMAGTGVVWSVLVQLFYFYANTFAFNLDTNVPIVKQGNPDSYFGFSVAQHQIYEERTGGTEHV